MKNKFKKLAMATAAVLFWAAAWQLLALTIDLDFVFPKLDATLTAFFGLLVTREFWSIIASSLLRILLGFLIGALLGIIIAPLTHYVPIANVIISPAMTVIKSTPVASFILVLWCIIGKSSVPTAIGILMVMPIVWQNLTDGWRAVSTDLSELCDVYRVGRFKKARILIFPTLVRYLVPALVTSSALAWKSGIAAEIIVYAKNSIGQEITNAKNYFESETMFAWTIAVIILSIILEFGIKRLMKAVKQI